MRFRTARGGARRLTPSSRVRRTEGDILAKIESIKAQMLPLKRMFALNSANLAVMIGASCSRRAVACAPAPTTACRRRAEITGSPQKYYIAFESDDVRQLFIQRFQSVRSASVHRLTKTMYRGAGAPSC